MADESQVRPRIYQPGLLHEAYRQATQERLTVDVWNEIIEQSIADARSGDAEAREFLKGIAVAPW